MKPHWCRIVDRRDVDAAIILSWVASLIFHKDRNYLVLGVFVKYFFFCDVIAPWHFQSSGNLCQIQYLGNIGSVNQSPMFLGGLNNLITIALYKIRKYTLQYFM